MLQIHADPIADKQQCISYNRPDGSTGSITVSDTHLVYKLTATEESSVATASSVAECKTESTLLQGLSLLRSCMTFGCSLACASGLSQAYEPQTAAALLLMSISAHWLTIVWPVS